MELNYFEINREYMRNVGKFYIQTGCLITKIENFDGKTLKFRVRILDEWPKDPRTTAIQIARSWKGFKDYFNNAEYYDADINVYDKITSNAVSKDFLENHNLSIVEFQEIVNKNRINYTINLKGKISDKYNSYWEKINNN